MPMLSGMPRTLRSRRHRALIAALWEARIALGLSQREVALRLKVSQTWLASIEAGQRRVDVVEFLDLCKALEVTPMSMLSRL